MDLNEIRNSNFFGKSKAEIVDFLGKACEELHLMLDMATLKNIIPEEQYAMIEAAIEKDTRDFLDEEQPGENTEEQIQEYVQEDIEDRTFSIKKGEDGNFILIDNESRMVDYNQISEINAAEMELSTLLTTVNSAIAIVDSRYGTGDLAWEHEELSNRIQVFSNALAEISDVRNKVANGLNINSALEIARITRATFSVNDLDALVNSNAASIAKNLRISEAKQMHRPRPGVSEEMIESLRKEYVNEDAYRIASPNGAKLKLEPDSSFLPELDFDLDKMQNPEFLEKILEAISKAAPGIEIFTGVYGDELRALIKSATTSKEQDKSVDAKKTAERFAKDRGVVLENENAQRAMEAVKSNEQELRIDDEQMIVE